MNRKRIAGTLLRIAHWGYNAWIRLARPITVGVRTIVLCRGQVLLVRHTYLEGWLLPGGGAKRGETLEQAARREVREETGLSVGELALVGLYTNLKERKTNHIAVFVCHIDQCLLPESTSPEIAEQRFFPTDALPEELLSGHARRIAELTQQQPELHAGMW